MATLTALLQIITDGLNELQAACAANGDSYPTLNDVYSTESNMVQNKYAADVAPVIAAAYQLIALLTNPDPYILNWGFAAFYSASIAVAAQGCVPDILGEARHNGMHVNDIAARNKMDPGKLGRILRLLASRHIFTEVAPDVFKNNRVSSCLCTGKPLDKWEDTNGVGALAEFLGTDSIKIGGSLVDNLTDPETALSQEPNKSCTQRAFGTDLAFHMWLQEPEQALSRRRLQHGMRSLTGYASDELPSGGFEWSVLPPGSVIVDVGGGMGTVTMDLANRHQHLRYVVEDLPEVRMLMVCEVLVIDQACYAGNRACTAPRHVLSVPFQCFLSHHLSFIVEHDFFDPQPIKGAAVYMIRYVLHNWSDAYCVKILGRLREVTESTTKLIVHDQILDYLSRDTISVDTSIPGAARPMAQEPLLPYPDAIAGYAYALDIQMMAVLNAQGRTLKQLQTVFLKAGWKLERVHRFTAPHPQQLICSPI
ncbi:hypothetical protein NM688_g3631 [Phlebia brevispora]|uniref:Uncharacterized protein n=1 Tax=Phlebia brevispora TaxID=194682 RepID=A0ACC1T505_9APHY|nr:hypothetical protein NM688_g3631 [Phlebia brevispora]